MKKLIILSGVLLSVMLILSGTAFGGDAAGQDAGSDATAQDAAGQDTGGEAAGQGTTPQGTGADGAVAPGTTTTGQEAGAEATTGQDAAAGQGITAEEISGGANYSPDVNSGGVSGESNGGSAARETSENMQGQGRVNINTASKAELLQVPGITRSLADNIIQYRDSNGPFNTVEDLASVQGMDQDKVEEIRFYTKVRGQTDIQPDLIRSPQSSPFPSYGTDAPGSPR